MNKISKIDTCGHLRKSLRSLENYPKFLYTLNSGGSICSAGYSAVDDVTNPGFSLLELYLATGFALSIEKQKDVNKSFSSYSLKHMCEVYIEDETLDSQYISNGAMITAMIIAGFDSFTDCGPNVFFNAKTPKVSRYKA